MLEVKMCSYRPIRTYVWILGVFSVLLDYYYAGVRFDSFSGSKLSEKETQVSSATTMTVPEAP
jgi:hypothetical protein